MNQPPLPARIPEHWGPSETGAHLRSLREKFTLTPQQVSERLHIRARYITAIEDARYEQMPGKVYARGYMHTYAEFLGLDPEQVVGQCFEGVVAESAAPKVVPAFAPTQNTKETAATKPVSPSAAQAYTAKPFVSPPVSYSSPWKVPALVAIVLLGGLYWIFSSTSSENAAPEIAAAPESVVVGVRSEVVPTGRNFACLTEDTVLGCFFAQETIQQLQQMDQWSPAMDNNKLVAPPSPFFITEESVNDDAN